MMEDRSHFPNRSCKKYEQDLILYYYGETTENEAGRIEAHLQTCEPCRKSLEGLRSILPVTVKEDHPPQSFWNDYSRELRAKLDQVQESVSWRERVRLFIRPWPVPTVATALLLLLALTLTLSHTLRRNKQTPPMNKELLEIFYIADNAEFFRNLDLLDSLELLETPGVLPNGPESA